MAADGIVFAQLRGDPNSLVVYRSRAAREANPERLNLDRRKLTQCPILENEGRIRLLNYQNNKITSISNLHNLTNLIFLDLYNNHITSLGDELSGVRALRVLMLGKNRLGRISHLEKLNKLDVLDLHSNNIVKMENLSTLNELRVLNLAGNKITTVENIGALQSLTELNLRRNKISEVYELNMLPTLQRLFLSNNKLSKFEDAGCVFKIKFLLELALDGNPMVEHLEAAYAADPGITISKGDEEGEAEGGEAKLNQARATTPNKGNRGGEDKSSIFVTSSNLYRSFVIENIKTLRHFDLKRVTEEERRQASVLRKRIEDRKRLQQKKNKINLDRKTAIRAAERAWAAQNGKPEEGEEDLAEGRGGGVERRAERLGTPNSRKMSPITVQQPVKMAGRLGQQLGKNSIEFTDGEAEEQVECGGGEGGGEGGDKYNYNEMLQVVDSPDRMGGFKSEMPGRVGGGDGAAERAGGGGIGGKQFDGSMATGPREGFKTVFSSLMSLGGNGSEGGKGRRSSSSASSSAWKGYYEVEAPIKKERAGEGKVLFIYGDGTDCFTENPNVVVDCTEVVFRYIDVDAIVQCAPHIFLSTKASKLTFSHNSFKAYSQIQKLNAFCLGLSGAEGGGGGGDLLGGGRRITEMEISPDGNPCATLSTFREFCAFAMNKLEVLDGVEVTRVEREAGKMMFAALKRTGGDGTRAINQYLPANLFKTGGRGLGLFNRQGAGSGGGGGSGKMERSGTGSGGKGNPALDDDLAIARCTEKLVVNMANMAIDTNKNRHAFEELYPTIMRDIMDEAIHQKMNQDSYMENCLEQLLA
ncbi:hypothetical protein TrRE_jg629 [Triparma retinervis]|uniref:Leucine-rich repeat protein n=1 Tax=Triparma retinervis TaxID=2557542 RepID=A0A9W6Z7V4_9STRA|nr:hypothetical protein TrRE_jg629 [Triparma retinervis]